MINIPTFDEFIWESYDFSQIISLSNSLNEGVHDKNSLKAVFVYGGPGSGKSYIISRLFDIPSQGFQSISYSTGLKSINPDTSFEQQLKKAGVPLSSLANLDDATFKRLTMGQGSLRDVAEKTTDLQADFFKTSRLGVIIQGTGKTIENVVKESNILRGLGYDCYCIYVNTPLNTALSRNAARERKLPDDLVKTNWQKSQDNIGKIMDIFGAENFIIVDNGDTTKTDDIVKSSQKKIGQFLGRPIKNLLGQEWLNHQK